MKSILIATAALSLMGGAAFAQTSTAPNGQTSDMSAPAASAPADRNGSTDAGGAPNASSSDMSAPSASSGAANTAPMASDSTGAMASNAPTGSAPESYPVCTSKHEDRCVNRYQATRAAKLATRHQKTDNVQPSGM
jgi:hypothetical protein